MKKLFAVLIALCLFVTGSAVAEAAEELTWDDIAALLDASGVEGRFVTFDEIAVKIWLPNDLQAVELTDEDRDDGYIGYFTDADQKATVAVMYLDVSGISVEDYASMLTELDAVEEVSMLDINGLPGVGYRIPDNDSMNIAIATQAGYLLEIAMAPLSVEGADIVWGIVAASIQPE